MSMCQVNAIERIEKKLDELKADFIPKSAVVSVLQELSADMHSPSDRPCATCRSASALMGLPYGCYAFQQRRVKKG